MTERQQSILHTVLALVLPLLVPAWKLLHREAAGLEFVVLWPFLFIIVNMQVVWLGLRSRRCSTEHQRKLSRKVYAIEGLASFFLGLYEAGSSLALSGVEDQRLTGVLIFTGYLYLPYAVLTLWGLRCLATFRAITADQPDDDPNRLGEERQG